MSKVRTTVYLDSSDYQRLKRRAEVEDTSAAELIRTAVRQFLAGHPSASHPGWIGSAASGDAQWAGHAAEDMKGFGES